MIFIPTQQNQKHEPLEEILKDEVLQHLWENLQKANIHYKQELHTILEASRQSGKTGKIADYNNTHFTKKDIDEILDLLATISN